MKYGIGVLVALGFGFVAAMASAQGPGRPDGDRGRPGGPPNREEILKRFDADGDGQLSPEEKQKAKEAMMRRRGGPGQGGPGRPGMEEGRGGPGMGGGQPGQLLMEVFKRSDRDGDGKLDPEEFRHAIQAMMQHIVGGGPGGRGPGGPGFGGPGGQGPGGPGFGGRGPGGFDRPRPGQPGPGMDRPQRGPRDFDRRGPGRPDVDRPQRDRPHRPDADRPRGDRPHRPDPDRPGDAD